MKCEPFLSSITSFSRRHGQAREGGTRLQWRRHSRRSFHGTGSGPLLSKDENVMMAKAKPFLVQGVKQGTRHTRLGHHRSKHWRLPTVLFDLEEHKTHKGILTFSPEQCWQQQERRPRRLSGVLLALLLPRHDGYQVVIVTSTIPILFKITQCSRLRIIHKEGRPCSGVNHRSCA